MQQGPRFAVITGAASGLGRALALRLAQQGWQLSLVDVDQAGGEQTRALVEQAGGHGRADTLDVADLSAWHHLRDQLQAQWPRLDLLVNNAGLAVVGECDEVTPEQWRRCLEVNFFGVLFGCRTFLDWLKANPGSHILNTASLAALVPLPATGAYSTAKAAVLALSETLYAELQPHRVGVTVLCPEFFASNLLDNGYFSRDLYRIWARAKLKRSGLTAQQVADAALRAVERKQLYVVEPRRARRYWRLKRLWPAWWGRLLARGYTTMLESRGSR